MALINKFNNPIIKNKYGEQELNHIYTQFKELRNKDFSVKRRNLLLELFKQGLTIYVNCSHSINIKKDKDILYLLNRKYIILCNHRIYSRHKKNFLKINNLK